MQKFIHHEGLVVPLDRENVDTDQIIPKQFLKSIARTGFGPNLFDEWRYLDHGEPGMDLAQRQPNPAFVLNFPRYQGATILLARQNFGCGSSREHAPWALQQYGLKAIIAPSFADIFFNNCFKNGLLPVVLSATEIEGLFQAVEAHERYRLTIDLGAQTIVMPGTSPGQSARALHFEIDTFRKHCLINGLDDIGLTLQHADQISAFEKKHLAASPWLSLQEPTN